jgi:predicted O-linked N-acetylglucosamine transferase (SPINDLY family)
VLCCFNTPDRISGEMMDAWLRVMRRVDDAVLWLRSTNAAATTHLRERAKAMNVDPSRLIFAAHAPTRELHIARHRLADIYLDTFPYNSHSTGRDALLAGLPLVTRSGRTFASRVAGSFLTALGLPELVATDLPGYETLLLRLTTDDAYRRSVRNRLAVAVRESPFLDTATLTKNIETALEAIHRRRLAGEGPAAISIDSDMKSMLSLNPATTAI